MQQGCFDLRDRAALAAFAAAFDAAHPVALLVVNAGVLDGTRAGGVPEDAASAREVLEINLLAAIDTVHALLPQMRARGTGRIALVSSLAALAPVPDAPAYSASKAGLLAYGRALRASLAGTGLSVSVACPGYVTSAMTASHIGKHPGEITADAAATRIAAGIARNRQVIGFPRLLYWSAMLTPFLPEALIRMATRDIRFHVEPAGKL